MRNAMGWTVAAVILAAGCGGSQSGPSAVEPPAATASPAAVPRPVPSWVDPALVGTLLLLDDEGWPKRWEAGRPFHHCFRVDPREVATAEAVAQRMTALTGIPRTEDGPCNVEWISEPGVNHTYTDAHGSARVIVYAAVHLYAANSLPVMLHEAGHVLGLGHSPRPDDLMNSNTDKQHDFSPDELAVLAWIYGR